MLSGKTKVSLLSIVNDIQGKRVRCRRAGDVEERGLKRLGRELLEGFRTGDKSQIFVSVALF